ncbi:MAG: FAD-dependent oxidoreductase [Chloroflexota bacterium]|nr:FAD-dependent oxidoreductase [Chloroflexota bacterium]
MRELECLFEPIKIGTMELKNRLMMAPMGTGYAGDNGEVSQRMIDYYAERARGGVGLIVVEACCVDTPVGRAGFRELAVDEPRHLDGLGRLAKAIHDGGSRCSLQLAHAGRYARSNCTGVQAVAPSAIASRYTKEMPRELTTDEVETIIDKFVEGARRAKEAGFDAVELMGSTGYLISQFFSKITNKRRDRYGGDTADRATFVIEIIHKIKEQIGNDLPICCKYSVAEYLPEGNTIEDSQIIARQLEGAGCDMLHAWAGWHESPVAMLPMSVERGAFVPLAEALKQVVEIPVVAVGRINDPYVAAQIIGEHRADLVAMGRGLIADADFPKKVAEGRVEDIRNCIACCRCFDVLLGGMQSGSQETNIVCSVNPELGREGERLVLPTSEPKTVLVVGAGPAGMETARVAAMRGHKVMLWEKAGQVGGNLVPAVIPPHKQEISTLTSYLWHQMDSLGVEVELNKDATVDDIVALAADEVVLATGATSIVPNIPGVENENVYAAVDVLLGKEVVGDKVVVLGGGLVGCETAEYLAVAGKTVTILARRDKIGMDIGPTTRWVTLARLREMGIQVFTSTDVNSIDQTGLVVEREGKTERLQADVVVLARGLESNIGLLNSLREKLPRVHHIGDCAEVAKIGEAIGSGWKLGCEL